MRLTSSTATIELDDHTGSLTSFRARVAPDQEFLVPGHAGFPAVVVQYLDDHAELREVSSSEAARVTVEPIAEGVGRGARLAFEDMGELGLSAVATIRAREDDPAILWELALTLTRPLRLVDVQFPFVVVAYDLGGEPTTTKLLRPYSYGMLYQNLRPRHFPPDWPDQWQLLPQNGDSSHYPGLTFAQLLAYYNERAGLMVSCRDATGQVKQIKPVHREPGLRLGIAHAVGWSEPGDYRLAYPVALEGFAGDWYDAAEIYRRWSLQQPWARTPLAERRDLPAWLADSPLHLVMRIQGEVDEGPTSTHPEFSPYENALPLLDRVAARLGAPLAPVIMSWERPGPWVYPDCFPPAGGADSLQRFTAEARRRDWHVGTYCNGTRWATAHKWSGYDGRAFFAANGGPESVSRLPSGEFWSARWDQHWRPSYAGCLGTDRTKELLWGYAQTLLDLGLDWIQILDQNVGASTFPCYARDHGHPAVPERWMTAQMERTLAGVRERGQQSGREIAWSVECPCCEYFLQDFVMCDIRPDFRTDFVPIFYYLYKDFIMTQAMFAAAPNPHFLVLKFARSFILGDVMGCHLGAGGRLQNWEPPRHTPWMDWDGPAGDQDAAYAVLRNATALRRGVGRDFLTFGRMLRPAPVTEVRGVAWTHDGEANAVPAVETSTWQARDGRVAVALANWTGEEQPARIDLSAFRGRSATLHVAQDGAISERPIGAGATANVALPARGCALLVLSPAS